MASGGRGKRKTLTGNSHKGLRAPTAMDKVARIVGKDRRTLEKARVVVRAAKAEPEKFGALKEDMDASGNVDRAFKELQFKKRLAAYGECADKGAHVCDDLTELAEAGKRFAVIYAVSAVEVRELGFKRCGRRFPPLYPMMPLAEIKALPVEAVAAKDCVLFLWCVKPMLPEALEVIEAWGFTFKNMAFNWIKQNRNGEGLFMGMGYWTRANSELCLLATRGSPQRMAPDVHEVIMTPIGAHSEKPEEARRRIERLVNGPYLELFARKPVPGWTVCGNEIEIESAEA